MSATLREAIQWNAQGLIPAIIQDHQSLEVLTLCYLNEAALERTLAEGVVYVFRRSQGRLMKKGETSGHVQRLRELRVDCEGRSLLLRVEQVTAACHEGYYSCYFRRREPDGSLRIVAQRRFNPQDVYRA